jgi:hypothetical protein
MDLVWWIDTLTPKRENEKRVGLSTYIVRGFNKVVRYYGYHNKSLSLTRKLVAEKGFYDHT